MKYSPLNCAVGTLRTVCLDNNTGKKIKAGLYVRIFRCVELKAPLTAAGEPGCVMDIVKELFVQLSLCKVLF